MCFSLLSGHVCVCVFVYLCVLCNGGRATLSLSDEVFMFDTNLSLKVSLDHSETHKHMHTLQNNANNENKSETFVIFIARNF